MDTKTIVDGPLIPAEWIHQIQTSAQSDFSSHAQHALDGCLFGLTPNAAQTHVQPGEAYKDGNRLRLRAAHALDLASITRPTGFAGCVGVGVCRLRDGRQSDRDRPRSGAAHALR